MPRVHDWLKLIFNLKMIKTLSIALIGFFCFSFAAEAGPAQRLAERRGITIRQARRIVNRPISIVQGDPNDPPGGTVYIPNYDGPGIVQGQ